MKLWEKALQQHGTPEDSIKQPAYFSGRNGLVFDFRHVFIQYCPYSISCILAIKPTFFPVTGAANYCARLRGVLEATANTLLNTPVSSHISGRRESRVKSSEYAFPRDGRANPLGRNQQSVCISSQQGIRVFLWNSPNRCMSFVWIASSGASFVSGFFVAAANFVDSSEYWSPRVRSWAVDIPEAYHYFSLACPSNRRNSMTARFLIFNVIFRFSLFGNGYRNPPCEAIAFEMRDLNVITCEMFGNELGRIPASTMELG
jgi:hypothetical protein